ncbi:protocadherin gamma-B2-like [Pyxicephalus adspersus]|uniref:protocadherin gamma-B2-like n=1 Tax=Pyxicephalus adspersus TaxID=30357 RepID=UPI003B5C99A9
MTRMKCHAQMYKGIRWQVLFYFLFSWLYHSVSGQIHYSIVEEMRKDSVISNIADDLGLDIKELLSRRLRIVSRVAEKYFYVNLDNGNLYVKDRIDRETLCGVEVTCYLTFDAVLENPLNILRIKVDIQDINDNPPVFYLNTFTFEAIESTPSGTRFALQNAKDPDFGINSVQSYKLSDNKYFTLSEKNKSDGSKFLELVLEKPLDRESQNVHEFSITATDGGKPMRFGTALIRFVVTDVNDNFPVFAQEVYKISVNENIPVNTTIVTVNATDKDEGINAQISYSFIETSGSIDHTETFHINSKTGEIKLNQKLDFELTNNYELSVQAKDGGALAAHCKVLIEVIDENDNAPEISITSLFSPIPEDSIPGTVIALIEVDDQDSKENANIDCRLIEQPLFSLVMSSDSYYRIVTTGEIDRETVSSYNITIVATDRGSPPLSSKRTIRLDISDVNDNTPAFMKSSYVVYIPENNLPGVSVCNIQASDPDSGDNAKIIYSISKVNTEDFPLSSYLSINMETGVLYAQKSFDFEQHKEFFVPIIATDNGSPSLRTNTTVHIRIVDQNDNAPRILFPSPGSAIESTPQGTRFALQNAEDPDSGINSAQKFNLSDNKNVVLTSDGSKYLDLVLEKPLDQESQNVHEFSLKATDGGKPLRSGTILIRIIGTDANDNVPVFTQEINKLSVNENVPINTTIITVKATDKDEGINAQISYSFSKFMGSLHHSGTFTIDPTTGEGKINKKLDIEITRPYELPVQARDEGLVILVEVLDENDNAPEISNTSLFSPIPEDAIPGTVIALIEVDDQDSEIMGETDREKVSSYNITIVATDRGSLSANTTVHIHILDQNDNVPRILFPSPGSGGQDASEMVSFTAKPGSLIKVVEVDEDSA